MANKYHRQSYKGGKLVQKLFENIYKLDTTGKKDKIIKSMNEVLKRKNIKASPTSVSWLTFFLHFNGKKLNE